ncbi:porin [Hydrogenimonas thermophila]|uniref:porin n=1 Tax=Hydrogenimonas thermophila TaxID=223786 RepID=UPI0029373DB9|nr:porin [Hydrogenimonas thermophila]WOE69654.1 porin [Hydrogenimonas thermophila]WOE72168.1 porin [Hydrogenimonas thermophila]
MKFAKLSLAAIMAMSVSAFADVQNIKVSGDAKLYYSTSDKNNIDLFDQQNSSGQAAVDIAVNADLANGVAAKASITMLNTLGLENNLVSSVWDGGLSNQWWMSEAWLAKTFNKTTIKIGRQELDTPLAFTETWSIAKNTFDAAVLLNQDIPKTTLVAAWVGRGNGTSATPTIASAGSAVAPVASLAGVVNNAQDGNDPFGTYYKSGAYAIAAVTTAIPMTTAQAWYYNVVDVATAIWLQADVAPMKGLTVGAQYANLDLDAAGAPTGSIWAVKAGYEMNGLNVSAAYSSTDKDAGAGANTATATGASKIYTEAWWTYGKVTAKDTNAWNLTAEYSIKDVADLGLYYTGTSSDTYADMTEVALTAGKSFGNLDTTLAYIYTDFDAPNTDAENMIQVYLTYNF